MFGIHSFVSCMVIQLLLSMHRASASAQQSGQCGLLNETQLYQQNKFTALNEYAWLGRVSYVHRDGEISYRCLAVLFNEQHALVPAYCVMQTGNWHVQSLLLGDWNAANNINAADCDATGKCIAAPVDYLIEEVVVHPDFIYRKSANDIAIIRLAKRVSFSDYVQPICLHPPEELPNGGIGQRLELAGFFVDLGIFAQKTRLKTQAQITCLPYCKQMYNNILEVTHNHICAFVDAESDLMPGSVLMGINVVNSMPHTFFVVGIALQASTNVWRHNVPTVFLRVWPYREWISKNS